MANFNDNAVPYGSRHADIYPPNGGTGGSGSGSTYSGVKKGTYILENITVTRPQFVLKRYNEVRSPNGACGMDDFVEGSATVQLATGSTAQVVPGDGFNITLDATIAAENFVITSIDSPESQGAYKMQTVRFQKLYNVTITATV